MLLGINPKPSAFDVLRVQGVTIDQLLSVVPQLAHVEPETRRRIEVEG